MNALMKLLRPFMPGPSCEEVNRFLADYMEGVLPAGTQRKFQSHLERCPDCKLYFEQYRTTVELVKEDRTTKIPDKLVDHTMEFLRGKLHLG